MSLQWTLVAGFLYAEIFLLVLFSVPFISAKQWNKLFKSRFLQVLSRQATWYFGLAFVILTMLLLDAIREMRKYSSKEQTEHSHLENELQISMRLFRAQRNFYISGFALFLSLVIKKFAGMISTVAQLEAENEAVMKQAKSASAAASALMKGSGETAQNASNEAHQQEMNTLKEELEAAKKKLTTVEKDRDAVVSQAKSLEKEYDRLNEEHHKLQLKLKTSEGDKKDD